jgi:hypothetical protein
LELPRAHRTVTAGSHQVPPLLILEGVRQLGVVMAHRTLGVPWNTSLILKDVSMEWPGDALTFPDFSPAFVDAKVEITDIATRRGQVREFTIHAEIRSATEMTARLRGVISCLSADVYQMVRRHARPQTLSLLKRGGPTLEVLETTPTRLQAGVHVDPDDTFVFDHAVDHVPGMLLCSTSLEIHELMTGDSVPTKFEISFGAFAELDVPLRVEASLETPHRTVCHFTQNGQPVAEATIERAEA